MLLGIIAGSLLLLPVFVTVGIDLGVQNQKLLALIQGKPPPGQVINPATGQWQPRTIETQQFCQKAYGFEPFPYRYLYNPNQWGDPDNTGSLCMNITTDNGIDSKDQYSFNWTATWEYPQGSDSEPVHAFPNALLNDSSLPLQISNLDTLNLDVSWSYSVGDTATNSSDDSALNAANLNANAAIDIFLSDNKDNASNSTLASHEVMIWFGRYGASTQPLGNTDPILTTKTFGGIDFELYSAQNSQKQYVFTWLANTNTAAFQADIAPFITSLSPYTGAPTNQSYVGYMAFGSEVFYATGGNMTFSVQTMMISINGS